MEDRLKKRDRKAFIADAIRKCEYMEIGESRPFRVKDAQTERNIRFSLFRMKTYGKAFSTHLQDSILTVTRKN